ncbi:MAG: sugar phosphate nucleotidyltransferase [Candidatus Sericytochromatia bacterium]
MKAVLMAGGSGTRLRPLTCDLPKPMVPIVNRPIIEHIVHLLKRHDFCDIYVTLYYLPQLIQNHLKDGKDLGVNVSYALEEEKPLGTAGCVKNIERHLDETFVVISGDSLTDFDLSEAVRFHKEKGSKATIVLARVENPLEFGVVITDEQGRIQRFLEKPTSSEVFSDTINTGIYVLEPELLQMLPANEESDFSKDLFPMILEQNLPMYGYVADGYWCDVGNLTTYRQAQYDVLAGKVNIDMPYPEVEPGLWMGEGVVLEPSVVIEKPAVIGHNTYLGKNVRISADSVLGDNVVVSQNATLKRPILWNGATVGRNASLSGCVLGKSVVVDSEARILEGAVIGDGSHIGESAQVRPEVRIWPLKQLEPNSIATESIIWGSGALQSIFGELGVSGTVNTDITPELAVKLGAAYGATIGLGKSISLSRDQSAASRLFSRAFASGVLSVGVHIQNLEATSLPVVRTQIKSLNVAGGVHVRIAPDHSREKISIEFLDDKGLNISPQSEKKIESTYQKEDFRRARVVELGEIQYPSRILEKYQEGFLKYQAGFEPTRPIKVVLDYMFQVSQVLLPTLLGKRNIDAVVLNAHVSEGALRNPDELERQTCDVVKALKADFGVRIDANGERLTAIDDKGQMVDHNALLAVFVQLLMHKYPGKKVAVPVMAPSMLEDIAARYGGEVIRTKSTTRSLMEAAQDPDVIFAGYGGQFIFPTFHGGFDAMMATGVLATLLALDDKRLSSLVADLPVSHMCSSSLNCPTALKGTLMRLMLEQYGQREISILDGVKLYEAGGWTLILPDPTLPKVHFYANGSDKADCERRLETYRGEIKALLQTQKEATSASR